MFDEFHERSLNSDLALAMVRRVQETVRPELKLVVMSATLAAEPIARWLGDCPVVESHGRLHPVEIRYLEDLRRRTIAERAADAVGQILDRTPATCSSFCRAWARSARRPGGWNRWPPRGTWPCCRCTATCPPRNRTKCSGPIGRRKVVLSTNVAETSLTIEGITGGGR